MTEAVAEEPIEGRDLTPLEQAQKDALTVMSRPYGFGIGLCGAHRTGKTTVAERIAAANPVFPFVKTSAREIAAQHGFDVNNPGSLSDRLDFQEVLLGAFEQTYAGQPGCFITDRTPIDMAAYMLADVGPGEIDRELDRRINAYVDRCISMADTYFGMIVQIQPGIAHVPVAGVPSPNVAYQEHLNSIMSGLGRMRYARDFYTLSRRMTKLDDRVMTVANLIGQSVGHFSQVLAHLPRQ